MKKASKMRGEPRWGQLYQISEYGIPSESEVKDILPFLAFLFV